MRNQFENDSARAGCARVLCAIEYVDLRSSWVAGAPRSTAPRCAARGAHRGHVAGVGREAEDGAALLVDVVHSLRRQL